MTQKNTSTEYYQYELGFADRCYEVAYIYYEFA